MPPLTRVIVGLGALVVMGALAFGGVYWLLLGGSSPRQLTIQPASTASPATTASASPGVGTWTVGTGSVAGYRVREQLAGLAAPTDAVGRTSSITGSFTLAQSAAGYTVTAATFTVDVSTLTSDRAMRDRRIHQMGLESDRYPTATFKLTNPIVLPATATTGQTVHVSATGDLTIHGTTTSVTIPMDAQLSGSQIQVVGSLTFPFSEFNMVPPSIGGFVSVQDNATMEFSLLLQKA
ncbi:MAG TPA: YceI family protein [Candidatus Limnocylindria bacterium]|nr:YceI family protein [Candidatus Limnocylindria bacterium]